MTDRFEADTWLKNRIFDHLKDKNRNVWIYTLNGTGVDPDWIDDRIERMRIGTENQRSMALSDLTSSYTGIARIADAEVRIKALDGWISRERKGKTGKDGSCKILLANSGNYDVSVDHSTHGHINSYWKIEHNPEIITMVYR